MIPLLKKNKSDNSDQSVVVDLEKKIEHLKHSIDAYKDQLRILNVSRTERNIYHDLSIIFTSAKSVDEFFSRTMEVLSIHLKARYYGIFWLNEDSDSFTYRFGKGYIPGLMSAIPRTGSLMGRALFKRDVLWIADMSKEHDQIPLNQDPREYNLLCAPIILFGAEAGVVRLANIDQESQESGKQILTTVYPLLCSSLERMQLEQKNKEALSGLEVSVGIARLLEKTLVEGDILKKVCLQIPKLFTCKACIIASRTGEEVKTVCSWPESFYLGGNQQSNSIYIRNLFEAYPEGNGCITNIHRDRRWAWSDSTVKSLCMAGFHVQGVLKGMLIVAGESDVVFSGTQQNLLGLVATQTSITLERASYFRKQEELASHDGLTGLYNHRMFQETVRIEIERVKRYKRPLALIMLDVDFFKKFNDTHGHPVGDEVLKMVALTLKGVMRATDRVFRYGGEEFCVILPETSASPTAIVAQRLRQKIESNRTVRGLAVTISCGITQYCESENAESFISRADAALYQSKKNGRNCCTTL